MVVKRYPHTISIKTSSGSVILGNWQRDEISLQIEVECNIQQKSNSYRDGNNEDSRVVHWVIFTKIFEGSDAVKIGDTIIPVSGITEFDLKTEHKILSYIIFQKHIEIEV